MWPGWAWVPPPLRQHRQGSACPNTRPAHTGHEAWMDWEHAHFWGKYPGDGHFSRRPLEIPPRGLGTWLWQVTVRSGPISPLHPPPFRGQFGFFPPAVFRAFHLSCKFFSSSSKYHRVPGVFISPPLFSDSWHVQGNAPAFLPFRDTFQLSAPTRILCHSPRFPVTAQL